MKTRPLTPHHRHCPPRGLLALAVSLVALAAVLALADSALAAEAGRAAADGARSNPEQVAGRVGDILLSWGGALAIGVAALVGLPYLAHRNVGGMVTLFVLLIALSGLVFAPDTMRSILAGFWELVRPAG